MDIRAFIAYCEMVSPYFLPRLPARLQLVTKPPIRLLLSAVALASWMLLLFLGWTLGGAVHLLLVGAAVAFPWREVRA